MGRSLSQSHCLRKPVQLSRTVRGGRRVAERALAALIVDTEGKILGRGPVTVNALLERWLEHITPNRSLNYVRSLRLQIDGRLVPAFGSVRLEKLGAEILDRQYRAWLDEGLSTSTVRGYHASMSAALHQAVKWEWITTNPAQRASPPTPRRNTATAPSVDDLRALVRAAEARDPLLATVIVLAALTGARRGELCALRWSDIDLEGQELTIARSLTVLARQVTEGPTKTHQIRRLALDPVALEAVRRRIAYQRELSARAEIPMVADPFLLSRSPSGKEPCKPDGLTQAFARLCRELELQHHLHELRHFAATMAIAAGVDIRSVSARLGHADASTTLRIYAGALKAGDRRAADALGQALGPSLDSLSPTH